MKIIKLCCDCCYKEVESQDQLYNFLLLDRITLYNTGRVEIEDKEICSDCLESLVLRFEDMRDESEKIK